MILRFHFAAHKVVCYLLQNLEKNYRTRCRAITGKTARWHCRFRHVSNFSTASCGFFATACISCWSLFADLSELSVKKWEVLERTSQITYL